MVSRCFLLLWGWWKRAEIEVMEEQKEEEEQEKEEDTE